MLSQPKVLTVRCKSWNQIQRTQQTQGDIYPHWSSLISIIFACIDIYVDNGRLYHFLWICHGKRLTFNSFQSKDSTIGDSQGCGLSIRSNSPNSPNFWQSKLLEPWNVQSKNSPFDPRFFLPSFLHSLHSGLGFLFSAQNAQVLHNCSTKKLDVSDTFVKKSLYNLQKSRSSSGWISHHSSPFIPIPRSRKFHAKNIALPRRSGYYRTSDERNMTEVARSCSDREIAIQETHGPSICAHNPHHNDFPYMSSVQMWKKKSHLRLADSLSPPLHFLRPVPLFFSHFQPTHSKFLLTRVVGIFVRSLLV